MNRDVWIYDETRSWVEGVVIDRRDDELQVQEIGSSTPYWCLPSQLLERNQEVEVTDLIHLPHLHEASILQTLRRRYDESQIYTYNGPILIAINPFQKIGGYDIAEYQAQMATVNLPHVYGIAERALTNLRERGQNQTILASGESGSGKTMTTKFLLHYFATTATHPESSGIEQLVLQSNPLMEAFGNAKTIMNDNSSRFGKFIRLDFSTDFRLSGGGITTYLLEKRRVVQQNAGERNFHIFYQMSQGATEEQKERWCLQELPHYRLIHQKELLTRDDGVEDADEWQATLEAFHRMGFSEDEQESIFQYLSGILALGNVEFEEGRLCPSEDLDRASHLLQLSSEQLETRLTQRILRIGHEVVTQPLSSEQIQETLETFIQESYDRLFGWIVEKINQQLQTPPTPHFIGVVDIFGFEIFDHNSLEQLQINYTNEYLQQQFNQHIFKLEQEEYQNEGIPWDPVDFPDNEQRLKTIHDSRHSLFSYLNDQCLAPQGTDQKILGSYQRDFREHPMFRFDPKTLPDQIFSFEHYAGWVDYCVSGFCHKNKLFYHQEIEDLIQELPLPLKIQHREQTMKLTTASTFKEQLRALIQVIQTTTPHYVRCLKPNDDNRSHQFQAARILQQLRYGGVLEAVKVSRAGFPIRFAHAEFQQRYWYLGEKDGFKIEDLWAHGIRHETLQEGKSKVFMKQDSYDYLEDLRLKAMIDRATRIQSLYRCHRAYQHYQRVRRKIIQIQTRIRIYQAKQELHRRRQAWARSRIYHRVLTWYHRTRYQKMSRGWIRLQRRIRWRSFFRLQQGRLYEHQVIRLQSYLRRLRDQARFWRAKRAVRVISNFWSQVLRKAQQKEWRDISRLNLKISEMEEQLQSLIGFRDALQQHEEQMARQEAKLRAKEEALRHHEEALRHQEEKLQHQEKEIQARDRVMEEQHHLILERNDQLEKKEEKITETIEVSHEICDKMNKLLMEQHLMKKELEQFYQERAQRQRSWFRRLFT